MLDQHLIAKFDPVANGENVVLWGKYRVTLLGDALFRLERSEELKFRDDATQCVWFRRFPKVDFTFTENADGATLSTDRFILSLKIERDDCRIDVGNGFIPVGNDGNLKGTHRTLDGCDGDVVPNGLRNSEYKPGDKIKLDDGVCSLTGVAVLDDSRSLAIDKNGKITDKTANGSDEYVFAFGDDYRGAVKGLFSICGNVPLLPRFALGNWWSRYYAYTQDEYIKLMKKFEKRGVPLTVATIDMDWHYSDYNEIINKFRLRELNREGEEYTTDDRREHMLGWTGYTWNERLFPNYKDMLRELKKRKLKTVLNLHPAQGIRFWENCYGEMCAKTGVDPDGAKVVPFDFTDDNFINAYFSVIHKPYEEDGVDFWWMDWQQGVKSKTAGLDPLWALNHYHFYDHAKNHAFPLILSRYAGIGSHRYPVGFSGDAYMTWKTLDYLPYFTATASNVGYGWWSHDIGGHGNGEKSDELYLRSVQYGVFSPINRLHCTNSKVMSKEPWYYGGYGLIAENFLRLRHSMLPFLYTANKAAHEDGRNLCEPLYYEYKNAEAYAYVNEYLFGGLIVAPITTKMRDDGFARVKVWLPEGEWTDIFTGDRYNAPCGGEERVLSRNIESIPVLAKAGSVIPFSDDDGNDCSNPENLRLRVFAGNGGYVLKEDDDLGENTACTTIDISVNELGEYEETTVKITFSGEKSVLPSNRVVTVELFDEVEGETSVLKDGCILNTEKTYGEYLSERFNYDADGVYVVKFKVKKKSKLELLKLGAERELLKYQAENNAKINTYRALCESKTVDEFLTSLSGFDLPDGLKARIRETV